MLLLTVTLRVVPDLLAETLTAAAMSKSQSQPLEQSSQYCEKLLLDRPWATTWPLLPSE
jgi:hypothetical protein